MATPATSIALPRSAYEEEDGALYPCVEEEPLVQSDWHDDAVFEAKGMLKAHFADRPEVYIGSDLFIFWEKGDPSRLEAPDIFVCPKAERHGRVRKSYRLWRELSGPQFVMEVLSDSTEDLDWGDRYRVYRDELRVPEYFIFDPHHHRRFWGFRLQGHDYVEIERDARERVWSQQLGLWFGTDDHGLVQLWDAEDRPFMKHVEAVRRAQAELRRAQAEAHRADAEAHRAARAEARVRELESELRKLRERAQDE